MSTYYKGLKDYIKDDIARRDRPTSLKKMIKVALYIDALLLREIIRETRIFDASSWV